MSDLPRQQERPGKHVPCTKCGRPLRPDAPRCGWCGKLRPREES